VLNHSQLQHTRCLRLLILVGMLLLTACRGTNSAGREAANQAAGSAPRARSSETSISISGAFALFPIVTVWTEEYGALHPDISFDVQAGGAGKGMTDMLSGAADIAMLSREARLEELEQGSFLVPVTIDAVVATANANNPYLDELLAQGITAEEAHAIWISQELATWGDLLGVDGDESINVYTRSDSAGAAEMWALFSLAEAQEDLRGTAVNADPGLAEAVRQDPLSIGFNNIGFAYNVATGAPNEGIRIVPLDLDGDGHISNEEAFYDERGQLTQAIADEVYPFPPARVLYLVTKGEPGAAIAGFYQWVLTDGQAYVSDAGYVPLTEAQLQAALELVPAQE
jgi:phosphate transport system substrate-binding protein